MIALEVSSAAGPPPLGGIGGTVLNLTKALLKIDPETRYFLCQRFSRWRKGHRLQLNAPNARLRVIQDPLNGLILPRARIFHSMATFLPTTPRIPKLVTIHDLNPLRNPQWVTARWHERRGNKLRETVSRADFIITPSAFTKQEVMELLHIPEERIFVVRNGVDLQSFNPAPEVDCLQTRKLHGDYVLSIGLLAPRKNFTRLAEAMAHIPELNWIHVGRPSNGAKDFFAAIEKHGLAPRFTHFSSRSHSELIGLLSGAQTLVVPSLYEGFGLTVLEAMACGTPVVCSNASSLPEAGGEAALYVDANSPNAISEAILQVVGNSDLNQELREKGMRWAQQCSWERAAKQLKKIYSDIAQ